MRMKYKIKLDSKSIYFIVTEVFLIILVLVITILYTKSEKRFVELQKQYKEKNETHIGKDIPSELSSYKTTSKEAARPTRAIALVEEFLKNYYESDSSSTYAKLINCEKYLSDSSLRKLCPYENDPEEITEEILQRIRSHDISLIDTESNSYINRIENVEAYYRGDPTKKEQVLAYFTVETYKQDGNHKATSTYIFECTIGNVDENLMITDILLKSPVVFPTYEALKN